MTVPLNLFIYHVVLAIFPLFCFCIVILIRHLLGLIPSFPGGYGRLLRPSDYVFDEDFLSPDPKCNIVATFKLDGEITIKEIRNLFQKRVLRAKTGNGRYRRLRYPEFQQYITSIFGFLIWKNERRFDIAEHIIEMEDKNGILDLGNLHQSLINRRFCCDKSPWQLILFRNVIPVDESNTSEEVKSVLAFRMHHIMGDAISVMKIFEEGIGKKRRLSTVNVVHEQEEASSFHVFFPLLCIWEIGKLVVSCWKHRFHPWKTELNDNSKLVVKFTKPMNVSDLKHLAEATGVTLSAVVMTLIAGAMRKLDSRLTEDGVMMGYVLPKKNHPNYLANHWRAIIGQLSTDEESKFKSLAERLNCYDVSCNCIKKPDPYVPFEKLTKVVASLPRNPLQKALYCNYYSPVLIKNIAGVREGFSIGGVWCSKYRMSVSAPRGVTGAVFCIFSYRNQLQISLIGRESVIAERDAVKIVNFIGQEYDELLCPEHNLSQNMKCKCHQSAIKDWVQHIRLRANVHKSQH